MFKQLPALAAAIAFTLTVGCASTQSPPASVVKAQVDWPSFIARHDVFWDTLPAKFDHGAFLGNGMLGATIYQEGVNHLRFEMGLADFTEHRRDNARLPIGGLELPLAKRQEALLYTGDKLLQALI